MKSIVVVLDSDNLTKMEIEHITGALIALDNLDDIRIIMLEAHQFGFMIKTIEEELREN